MEQLFSLEYMVSILLSGISLGGQLALIAIGYTMVYGILRLINFAHGDVFMVAGLLGIYISAVLPIYVAIPVVIILTVALGFFIERAAYKPLRNAPRMSVMISAIGVSYLLQNTATYVTGGQPMTYPTIGILNKTIDIVGTSTKLVVIITPVLVLVLIVLLTQLINHTKIGMAMRAVSKDFETGAADGHQDQQRHFHDLCHRLCSGSGGLHSVLHHLSSHYPHGGRHAGTESLRGGGVRRHRLHPRRGDRRVPDRHLRDHHQGPALGMECFRVL